MTVTVTGLAFDVIPGTVARALGPANVGPGWCDDTVADETHPLTPDCFDDFADVVNRSRRPTHCWCVTHRLTNGEVDELGGGDREQAMRALCGFAVVGTTEAKAGGLPRLVMRRELTP